MDNSRAHKAARREKARLAQSSSLMTGSNAAARAWRREQAHADADIEGLARDPGADALVAEMDAADLSPEERRERLIAYFQDQARRANLAAE